jgi:hypothetical protein
MATKLEGTFCLEGMFEGPWRREDDLPVSRWGRETASHGISFHAEVSSGTFSIVPSPGYFGVPQSLDLKTQLEEALNNFLDILPAEDAEASFSTIRSVEYQPGKEIQTVYAIGPSRRIQAQQRSLDATTTAPPKELTGKALGIRAAIALACVAVIIAGTMPFVPYKRLLSRMKSNMVPVKSKDVTVELGHFDGVLKLRDIKISKGVVTVTLDFSACPDTSDESLSKVWKESTEMREKLAMEALFKGQLLCKCFNTEGKLIGKYTVELSRKTDQLSFDIPCPPRLNKLKLCL